jgi:hypothetical protein
MIVYTSTFINFVNKYVYKTYIIITEKYDDGFDIVTFSFSENFKEIADCIVNTADHDHGQHWWHG